MENATRKELGSRTELAALAALRGREVQRRLLRSTKNAQRRSQRGVENSTRMEPGSRTELAAPAAIRVRQAQSLLFYEQREACAKNEAQERR